MSPFPILDLLWIRPILCKYSVGNDDCCYLMIVMIMLNVENDISQPSPYLLAKSILIQSLRGIVQPNDSKYMYL